MSYVAKNGREFSSPAYGRHYDSIKDEGDKERSTKTDGGMDDKSSKRSFHAEERDGGGWNAKSKDKDGREDEREHDSDEGLTDHMNSFLSDGSDDMEEKPEDGMDDHASMGDADEGDFRGLADRLMKG